MIKNIKVIKVEQISKKFCLSVEGKNDIYKEAIFLDLEHYIYKVPICIGVFGACSYDEKSKSILLTQYMIENERDSIEILHLAYEYLIYENEEKKKKYLVTFAGNNDYVVMNHLFQKNDINLDIKKVFKEIDIQSIYEKQTKERIGLKNLEKKFLIDREGELISGSNLAKTFHHIYMDDAYIHRMETEKIGNILLYNEQDIVNLLYIYTNWNKYI